LPEWEGNRPDFESLQIFLVLPVWRRHLNWREIARRQGYHWSDAGQIGEAGMMRRESKVTIHMAASLDGFIARADGRTDWMETADEFPGGESMDPEFVQGFLQSIDCYVMGSRTYETALAFDAAGSGWAYGDKPVFVLTKRKLQKSRDTVELVSADLAHLLNERLKPAFRNIWIVGGSAVAGEAVRRGLADEVRYSILPVLIGNGVRFFESLDHDVALHLLEVKAYKNGIVALRHSVKRAASDQQGA
jgi:dihydrofolate reductase